VTSRTSKLSAFVCLLASILPGRVAHSQPTTATLTFEEFARGTTITRDYWAEYGVAFPDGVGVDTSPQPHSGTRVLHLYQGEFSSRPIVIELRAARSRVKLFAGTNEGTGTIVNGTLKAMDTAGNVVAQDGAKQVTASSCSTPFEVTTASPVITRLELTLIGAYSREPGRSFLTDIAIDDLELEGPPLPVLSGTPPAIQITSPKDGDVLDASTLSISATAAGALVTQPATVSIDTLQPGDHQHHPPDVFQVALVARRFPIPRAPSFKTTRNLPVGLVEISVQAESADGVKGLSTIHVVNLPTAITGTTWGAGFTKLAWVAPGADCVVAVYENGAVAASGGKAIKIEGPIFYKWQAWTAARYNQLVFPNKASEICPNGPDMEILGSGSTGRVQHFRAGSIYASPDWAFYVPRVFQDVISRIGDAGVPISDPIRSVTANTWLYQQFRRAPGVISTIEIKGTPPVIWVERPGGDLKAFSAANLALSATTPTVWESASCSGNEGPCGQFASELPPIDWAPKKSCPAASLTPEWVARVSDATMTPLMGFAAGSGASDEDNAATHELNYNYNIDGSYHARGYWSDWDMAVVPFKPYWKLLGEDRGSNITTIELEFEYGRAAHMFALKAPTGETHEPKRGDLVFASGRWILDCGHSPFQTEIHPPFALTYSRTVLGPPQRTLAFVWVNGWYLGEAFDVDLYPPPRPSPTHTLSVTKPNDAEAATDVLLDWSSNSDRTDPVRLHFHSTTLRKPNLGDGVGGQLFHQDGRSYEGVWSLTWVPQPQFQIEKVGATWWP
jgi:hypothetical protein